MDVAAVLKGLDLGPIIGGELAPTETAFDVVNPATGDVIAAVGDGNAAQATAALDAACAAGADWAATLPRERSEILRRAYEIVVERTEEIACVMTAEMGKPLAESRGEVTYGAEFLRWFAEEAVRVFGRTNQAPSTGNRVLTMKKPVGPVLAITPWNFPLAMGTRKVAPALAAGCTVVLKPASATPLTTLMFMQALSDAGLPDGVVNVITSSNSKSVSEALLPDRRLRKLTFTGSTEVGRVLLKQAADRETGLVEQAVAIEATRRTPESARRASQRAEEIAGLCLSMHAALVSSRLEKLQRGIAPEEPSQG